MNVLMKAAPTLHRGGAFAEGMGQRSKDVARKDAPITSSREGYAGDMGQRMLIKNADLTDAPTMLCKEECALGTGQRSKDVAATTTGAPTLL